jgi:DNA replication licensing factor MCM7
MATVGVLPVANIGINYEDELVKISDFISKYIPAPRARRRIPADDDEEAEEDDLAEEMEDMDVDGTRSKYMKVLRKVANRQTSEVVIDLADLRKVEA